MEGVKQEMDDEASYISSFHDVMVPPDPVHDYTPDMVNMPIVIDNGSYKCRVGWLKDEEPRVVFKNVTAKQRSKKSSTEETSIGNDITNIEVMRWQLKSQFDRNMVTHYDAQENVFDHIFTKLGITTEGCIDHPIVLTEPICNPNYSRQQMSELLFECYHIPKVSYGVDALFSYYNNFSTQTPPDSLLVSCGYNTTHIVPVLDGQIHPGCRRINVGGSSVDYYMQRLLQLRFPAHLAAVTLGRAEELVHRFCKVAVNYPEELGHWSVDDYYLKHVDKIQLPFNPVTATNILNSEQKTIRREEQVKRMKQLACKRRDEKLADEQEKLEELISIQELLDEEDEEDEYAKTLKRFGFSNTSELTAAINKLNNSIHKITYKIQEEELADIMATADNKLTDEQREMKRQEKERLKKTAASEEPQAKKQKQETKKTEFGSPPRGDKTEWLQTIRDKRQGMINRQVIRRQRRADMTKRRTHASQQRMKIITELAQGTKKKKKDDTFGMKDEDWNVYKAINKDGGDSDSEEEQEKIDDLENLLREHDPEFKDPILEEKPVDINEYYRLHVAVEKIRCAEVLFQPSMLGIEQAGIAETIDFVLKKFNQEEQERLAKNVFITGGCASFPSFNERLERELTEMRPFESISSVSTAARPVLDSWYGARRWTMDPSHEKYYITKSDYDEYGGEYLKPHLCSNHYMRSPAVTSQTEEESQDT